ncbi:MAG: hypothetical protein AMXMBFR84_30720 [Candidatus Hydrogenedentota bacterium]
MTQERYKRLNARIQEALDDRSKSRALLHCMQRGRDNRSVRLQSLPGGASFRGEVKGVKERCIADQERLVAHFTENAEKRGVKVFRAASGMHAIEYMLRLARSRGAKTIAKSKSLTTEEIELNQPLTDAGMRVVETDLGELIIQLVDEKPYHLVFPSVHKMAPEVAEIFSKATGAAVSPDIPSIMKVVRTYLRPIFLSADIGLTGANIGIAETGGIVIETNEGNGRLVSSIGDCHVCVMGLEKIVATVEDALLMVMAHPVSASGQLPTTYVTWMHGHSPLGEASRARESHIILLDNGRTAMRDDPAMREALHCIRCGACMNVCPTYGVVGGHTFGYIYPGPIGIPWTAQVHGMEKAAAFAPLCISCGLCKEICPADIDIPMMIATVKHRDAKVTPHSKPDRTMMKADRFARLGSVTARVANWMLKNPAARAGMEAMLGVSAKRVIPPFDRTPFTRRFHARTRPEGPFLRRVALFVDVYAEYNAPHLAMKAVSLLEAAGCEVVLPDQRPSGYPFIAYGDLDRARETAEYNVDRLAPFVKDGCEIVSIEPTAAYCLHHSYAALLAGDDRALLLANHSHELFPYLLDHEGTPARTLEGRRLGFHIACHQRPMSNGEAAIEWLRRRGAEVSRIETGTCCGMGGTFGLKAGPLGHGLSMAVGEPLFALFKNATIDTIVTESSVCGIQLREGTKLPVLHPLQLL